MVAYLLPMFGDDDPNDFVRRETTPRCVRHGKLSFWRGPASWLTTQNPPPAMLAALPFVYELRVPVRRRRTRPKAEPAAAGGTWHREHRSCDQHRPAPPPQVRDGPRGR